MLDIPGLGLEDVLGTARRDPGSRDLGQRTTLKSFLPNCSVSRDLGDCSSWEFRKWMDRKQAWRSMQPGKPVLFSLIGLWQAASDH